MSRAQGAGIGAVAGAMIGVATGRSVKSAVIGAAAGGMLGTIVVRQRQ
jgi:outer membrane lipoprotein SlyB